MSRLSKSYVESKGRRLFLKHLYHGLLLLKQDVFSRHFDFCDYCVPFSFVPNRIDPKSIPLARDEPCSRHSFNQRIPAKIHLF